MKGLKDDGNETLLYLRGHKEHQDSSHNCKKEILAKKNIIPRNIDVELRAGKNGKAQIKCYYSIPKTMRSSQVTQEEKKITQL